MTRPPLTPARADRILQAAAPARGPKILWGAAAIAGRIGRSEDFVRRTLSKLPGSPVKKVAGQFCACEEELMKLFRP
ncbi:hypothetical protein ACRC7T_18490 [Segnochrobactraceae bacterium EtOH-i3]